MSRDPNTSANALVKAIGDFVGHVPATNEPCAKDPKARARVIASSAALTASALSGTLALPPGPAGIVTIVPELIGVWKVQAQMIADLAGAFGKTATLTREQMLYCLFKHAAAQAVRDLVVRVGERALVQRVTVRALQKIAEKVGIKVSHRVIASSVTRWVPAVGALGVAAYAYYDTSQVAATAIELFEQEIRLSDVVSDPSV